MPHLLTLNSLLLLILVMNCGQLVAADDAAKTPKVADPYAIDKVTRAQEERILSEIESAASIEKGLSLEEKLQMMNRMIDPDLNAVTSEKLRSRSPKDPPVRYRRLIALAKDIPSGLAPDKDRYCFLNLIGPKSEIIGILLIERSTEAAKAVEKALSKEPVAAIHVWMRVKSGELKDVYLADRVVSVSFGFSPP